MTPYINVESTKGGTASEYPPLISTSQAGYDRSESSCNGICLADLESIPIFAQAATQGINLSCYQHVNGILLPFYTYVSRVMTRAMNFIDHSSPRRNILLPAVVRIKEKNIVIERSVCQKAVLVLTRGKEPNQLDFYMPRRQKAVA